MSGIIKIKLIVFFLLLRLQLAQLGMHIDEGDIPEYLSNGLDPQKKQRSWDFEEEEQEQEQKQEQNQNQWQIHAYIESQSGICSAESPHDVRYEKNDRCKTTGPKKIIKDEDDDDEEADPAANGDEDDNDNDNDEEDDDDEDNGDDEGDDEDGDNGMHLEDEAFVERITCLLGSLHKHTKAMTDNLKILRSRLGARKNRKPPSQAQSGGSTCRKNNFGTMLAGHPTHVKWLKKPDFYGEEEPCGQEKCDAPESSEEYEDIRRPQQAFSEEHRLLVPPLLQLIQGSATLQSHLKDRQETAAGSRNRYWMPSREQLATEELELQAPPQSLAEDESQLRCEDYEARLRRLMDNRDEIERNVMRMISPRH
ncbi:hypothetical protein KR084_011107 [Drosophila pseudotakahashii]|nr:hypothetical protein KR084_011107 [Drosophila pseudotakahashii]